MHSNITGISKQPLLIQKSKRSVVIESDKESVSGYPIFKPYRENLTNTSFKKYLNSYGWHGWKFIQIIRMKKRKGSRSLNVYSQEDKFRQRIFRQDKIVPYSLKAEFDHLFCQELKEFGNVI